MSMRIMLVAALIALTLLPLATADPPTGRGAPPDAALFGLCTAWANNDNGRQHGNAENAPPFVHLQQQAEDADQSVEEYCAEVSRPGP